MRSKLILAAVALAVVAGSFAAKSLLRRPDRAGEIDPAACRRIVSLSPSITEILFALGLGDRVVGVTRFCRYPPEAQTRTFVGGYLDTNLEAIVALEPDLIVLRGEREESVAPFTKLGLRTLAVRHDTIEGILDSILAIGRSCGAEARAEQLVSDLKAKMERLEQRTAGLPRVRVMLVADRTKGIGKIENVYVAGAGGFLDRMIELAGGHNVCTATGFPVVSGEGILHMNPEVIVDLAFPDRPAGQSPETIVREWRQLAEVDAVRDGRVYVVEDDFALIPGPRFILLAEKLARLFHPEKAAPR